MQGTVLSGIFGDRKPCYKVGAQRIKITTQNCIWRRCKESVRCSLNILFLKLTEFWQYLSANSSTFCGPSSDKKLHTTWSAVSTSDINLGSLTLPASEAGDFAELILLNVFVFTEMETLRK